MMLRKVLFVCLGNICRSPAAEGVFQHLVNEAGFAGSIGVDSAGTLGYHTGKPADARMRQAAAGRGYELLSRARQVQQNDLDEFDLIVAMDRSNLAELQAMHSAPAGRLCLLSDFLPDRQPLDVPDPYYGGTEGFEKVLDLLELASPAILLEVLNMPGRERPV